jgi:hypothetical protein
LTFLADLWPWITSAPKEHKFWILRHKLAQIWHKICAKFGNDQSNISLVARPTWRFWPIFVRE